MQIRHYHPGDEQAQAAIYNAAAKSLPAFKPAAAEEIGRRYRTGDADPTAKFYAVVDDQVVGYAVFNPNGRISYPWCISHAAEAQSKLLAAVQEGLRARGCNKAWATYRADWKPILAFLSEHGFNQVRELINYVAELERLPATAVPTSEKIVPLTKADANTVWELGRHLFDDTAEHLERFYFGNPFFDSSCVYLLRQEGTSRQLGVGVAITNPAYADPTQINAAMPCFRLGAIGTERERHKRVNGMFSCVFSEEDAGEVLLAEARRRFAEAGLRHAAAQAPSDEPALIAFYDRYFTRQGSFPILAKNLRD